MAETVELADLGVLGVEMEAAALYYLGAKFHVQTLAICTVSDHIITGERNNSGRETNNINDMIKVGLETAIS